MLLADSPPVDHYQRLTPHPRTGSLGMGFSRVALGTGFGLGQFLARAHSSVMPSSMVGR